MPRGVKIPDAKVLQWIKKGKTWQDTGMAADESQKQKRGDRRSKEWGQKSSCCVVNGHVTSPEFGVGARIWKIQRPSGIPRWHCKRWFRLLRNIYRASFIGVTNGGCKSNGCHVTTTRMRRRSSWRSICLYPGKNGGCYQIIEKFQNWNVQMFGHVYQNTNGPNCGPAWKTQSFLLSEICTVIFWQDCYGKGKSGKYPNCEHLFVNREK